MMVASHSMPVSTTAKRVRWSLEDAADLRRQTIAEESSGSLGGIEDSFRMSDLGSHRGTGVRGDNLNPQQPPRVVASYSLLLSSSSSMPRSSMQDSSSQGLMSRGSTAARSQPSPLGGMSGTACSSHGSGTATSAPGAFARRNIPAALPPIDSGSSGGKSLGTAVSSVSHDSHEGQLASGERSPASTSARSASSMSSGIGVLPVVVEPVDRTCVFVDGGQLLHFMDSVLPPEAITGTAPGTGTGIAAGSSTATAGDAMGNSYGAWTHISTRGHSGTGSAVSAVVSSTPPPLARHLTGGGVQEGKDPLSTSTARQGTGGDGIAHDLCLIHDSTVGTGTGAGTGVSSETQSAGTGAGTGVQAVCPMKFGVTQIVDSSATTDVSRGAEALGLPPLARQGTGGAGEEEAACEAGDVDVGTELAPPLMTRQTTGGGVHTSAAGFGDDSACGSTHTPTGTDISGLREDSCGSASAYSVPSADQEVIPGSGITRGMQLSMLDAILKLQGAYIDNREPSVVFGTLLTEVVRVSRCELAFIGEVFGTGSETHMVLRAVTNMPHAPDLMAMAANGGHKFSCLDSIYGHVLRSGQPYISTDPAHDPHAAGTPPGHPAMQCFCGIPAKVGGSVVGLIGLANRSRGFSHEFLLALSPLVSTVSAVLQGYKQQRTERQLRLRAQHERRVLDRSVQEATAELRAAQITLQTKNTELEREKLKLERAKAGQQSMFGKLTHEVKNPLYGMKGHVRELLDDAERPDTNLDADQIGSLNVIASNMNQISLVVEDILALIKMNTRAMTVRPYFVSLPTIVQLMMASYEPDARAKGRSVYSAVGDSVPPLIMTDKQRIRQVMDNYTYNAIKYAGENVRIVVSASAPFSRSEALQWARGTSDLDLVTVSTATGGGSAAPPSLPSLGPGQVRTTSGSTVYANVFSPHHEDGNAAGGSGQLVSRSYEGHQGVRSHLSGSSQVLHPPASVGAGQLGRGGSGRSSGSAEPGTWPAHRGSPEQTVAGAAFDQHVADEHSMSEDAADEFVIKSNPAPGARTVTEGHPTPVVTPLSASHSSPEAGLQQLDLHPPPHIERRSASDSAEAYLSDSDGEGDLGPEEQGSHVDDRGSVSTVGGSAIVAVQAATVESAMRFCGWQAPPLPPSHVMALGRQFAPVLPALAPLCAEDAAAEDATGEEGTPSAEDVFVYVLIEVLDDGRGITPFVASKLFRPFVQEQDVEGGGMSEAGTGLGLAIVHELATLFNGKAFVVSNPGEGSSFRFLFPARLPRDSDAPAGHSLADMLATVAGAGMTVNAAPPSQAVTASVTSAADAPPPTVPSEASDAGVAPPPLPPLGDARSDSHASGASAPPHSVGGHSGISTAWISELEGTPPDMDAGRLLSLGSPRVLLVDDAVINRKLQAKWLKKMGVPPENVFHAASGEQAVACVWQGWCAGNPGAAAAAGVDVPAMKVQVQEAAMRTRGNKQLNKWIPGPVDIVILDMGMEPGNGYSVVRELRRMFMALLLVAAGEHAAATALVQPVSAGTTSPNGFVFPDPMPSTVVAGVAAPVPHFYDFPAWTSVPPLPRASRVVSTATSHSTAVSRGFTGGASRHSSTALTHLASSNGMLPASRVPGSGPGQAQSGGENVAAAAGGGGMDSTTAPRIDKPARNFKFPVFGNARAQPSEQRVLDVMCPVEGTGALPAVVRATLRAVGHPYLIANTGNIDDQERCLGTLGMDGFLNKEADMGREKFCAALLEAARWWRDTARMRVAAQSPDGQLQAVTGVGAGSTLSVAGMVTQLKTSLMLV